MSKQQLSSSSTSRYMMCPTSYKYHYIDKIRPIKVQASLLFGSAIDGALNELVTIGREYEKIFIKAFTYGMVNSKDTYLPTCPELVYANSDYDNDLVFKEDITFLTETLKRDCTNILEVYKELSSKKQDKGIDSLTQDELLIYNLLNWVSLKNKGLLMLEAYKQKIVPHLTRVLSVQEYTCLDNGAGDKVVAYVDMVAEYKDQGIVVFDNKTSSIEYDTDSVLSSAQLSLYVHCLEQKYNTRKAGYIVMNKRIVKNRKKICSKCGNNGSGGRHKTCDAMINGVRCHGDWNETIDPDVNIQVIIDQIPLATEQLILENIDDINTAIKNGHYTKNLNSCHNWYGGKCSHFDLCYRGKMTGLTYNKENENGR